MVSSVWSVAALSLSSCPPSFHHLSSSPNPRVYAGHRKQHVFCCKNSQEHAKPSCCVQDQQQLGTRRRGFMLDLGFAAFSFPAIVSNAMAKDIEVAEGYRVYTDDENKYKIVIPKDWQMGAAEPRGFNNITAFYPEDGSGSNVSIVITGLGADFTRMESFGKVDEFAETLVSGLDRSWKDPPGVTAKLIDCKASKGIYYIQYTLQNPGEARRYLYSALGMASNGWVNRLFTVTGQFMEDKKDKYSSEIEKVVTSFSFI
uniref:Photosystem II reaction center PsbP family protein n=1 Tax=Pelargonium cotyledonis TaxID=28968 RepID=A0A0G4AMC9_9ROSI|nr:photosystem II reaction center PsbP family protein [Pelargonium cotyledonis]